MARPQHASDPIPMQIFEPLSTTCLTCGNPAPAIAAVSGIDNTEQGLAAGLQGTSLQTGGGFPL